MFAGDGARMMIALEKGMQRIVRDWSTRFLVVSVSAWLREYQSTGVAPVAPMIQKKMVPTKKNPHAGDGQRSLRMSAPILYYRKNMQYARVEKAAKVVPSMKGLQKLLMDWSLKSYTKNYKRVTGSVAVGASLEAAMKTITYRTTELARVTYTKLQGEFYNSTREYMAKLGKHGAKYGVPISSRYVGRQLRGLPGASPYQRAGVPEPPVFRFQGKPLRTFGDNGINGSRDPFQVSARARVIARTEMTQARNEANMDGFKATGRKFLMWIGFDDERTRESHKELLGRIVPMGTDFTWQTEDGQTVSAPAPGDPSLPPEERINCRCEVVAATEKQYLRQEGLM